MKTLKLANPDASPRTKKSDISNSNSTFKMRHLEEGTKVKKIRYESQGKKARKSRREGEM